MPWERNNSLKLYSQNQTLCEVRERCAVACVGLTRGQERCEVIEQDDKTECVTIGTKDN